MEVPWIISGPGVVNNKVLSTPNNIFNTASTILYLLDLNQPEGWIGQPVLDAFNNSSDHKHFIPQPVCSLSSGLSSEAKQASFTVSDPESSIRYTLDGSEPDQSSEEYTSPILLIKSTDLKAAAFNGNEMSRITRISFERVLPIKWVELKTSPSEKYQAKSGSYALTDLELGSSSFSDGRWLGYQGGDMEALLFVGDNQEVSKIRIGCLNKVGSWIFLPDSISVMASVNNSYFYDLGSWSISTYENKKSGRNDIDIPLKDFRAKYYKVKLWNRKECPPGHAGEGEPAWMFIDEIIVQ